MTTAVSHSAGPRMLLAMVAACVLAWPFGPASAQKPTLDDVKQRDQELDAVRAEQKKALESQKALRDEINALGEDRRKLNQALIDTAGGIRSVEGRVAAAEARLQQL